MRENFALQHSDNVHAGFCKGSTESLMEMKVKCSISRADIEGILKIFHSSFFLIHLLLEFFFYLPCSIVVKSVLKFNDLGREVRQSPI